MKTKAEKEKAAQDKITDLQLVKQFKKGSLVAFEELIERYETKIFNMSLRLTKNREDAEEVLQDVFTTLYRKVSYFEGKSAFSSWLYRIVVNASFMKLRKKKSSNYLFLEDLAPTAQQHYLDSDPSFVVRSDTLTMNGEMRGVLHESIGKLPDQYRSVFVLRDIDGLSNQEVGEILKLSIPAVKSRLHRSRLMLRKKLLGYYRDFSGRTNLRLEDLDTLPEA